MSLSPLQSWLIILTGGALFISLMLEISKCKYDENYDRNEANENDQTY
jgi:hypothetical protein